MGFNGITFRGNIGVCHGDSSNPKNRSKKNCRLAAEHHRKPAAHFRSVGDSLFTSYGHLWSFATAFSKSSIKVFVLFSADLAGHILVDS